MRALNKKLMTLACATCLTVGMGAVAYADTVDLGYGLYGNTSPTVKAVEVIHVPTDAKLRNNEQSQMISAANKAAMDAVNVNFEIACSSSCRTYEGRYFRWIFLLSITRN